MTSVQIGEDYADIRAGVRAICVRYPGKYLQNSLHKLGTVPKAHIRPPISANARVVETVGARSGMADQCPTLDRLRVGHRAGTTATRRHGGR
jgi:hypothetical protein